MASIVFTIKVRRPKISREIRKALKQGAGYRIEFTRKRTKTGEVLTPKIVIDYADEQCDLNKKQPTEGEICGEKDEEEE